VFFCIFTEKTDNIQNIFLILQPIF
jgi:hypothetical protein